jgi:hypothetical protein
MNDHLKMLAKLPTMLRRIVDQRIKSHILNSPPGGKAASRHSPMMMPRLNYRFTSRNFFSSCKDSALPEKETLPFLNT